MNEENTAATGSNGKEAKKSAAPAKKRVKVQQPKAPAIPEYGEWFTKDGVVAPIHVFSSPSIVGCSKICGFNLDGTLIETRSGGKFAMFPDDWRWVSAGIPATLKKLTNEDGYKVVVFTNQFSISTGEQKLAICKAKLNKMCHELGFAFQLFVCTGNDHWRMPYTDMWEEFVREYNQGVQVDKSASFFVGAEAGRPKGWAPGRPKDVTDNDRAFAANVGIHFKTPEEYFLNQPSADFAWSCVDPYQYLHVDESTLYQGDIPLNQGTAEKQQEVIILVGSPAAGKTTFVRNYLLNAGYIHINRDTAGGKTKCVQMLKNSLASGYSVAYDSINPHPDDRAPFLQVARESNVRVRAFVFSAPLALCLHLNNLRYRLTGGNKTALATFKNFANKLQIPTKDEGFFDVSTINFVPKFDNDVHKKYFLERS